MPRLVILCEYPTLLGGERSMLATLPVVSAVGFDIAVAAPPDGPLAAELAARDLSHVPWSPRDASGRRQPLGQLRAQLADLIRHVEPELLHANSLSTARIAGPVVAECSARSIGHLRDIVKLPRAAIADLNRHTRLIAVSFATREFHVRQGLDGTRCEVAYNGVDLDEFRPRPKSGYLHEEFALPGGAPLVAVIGQLGLRKGTEVALSAALQASLDFPDAHWLIVGERTSMKQESRDFERLLHAFAAESALAGSVHLLGNRPDVPLLLNECELLVHAARQEPLGRVLLEAAASGVAVVATDVGGTREIFPTEADGALLVPADRHMEMARAVVEVLQDNSRRQQLAAAARRRAERAFDIRQAADRLLRIYESVICAP